jgi:hypothetical protein
MLIEDESTLNFRLELSERPFTESLSDSVNLILALSATKVLITSFSVSLIAVSSLVSKLLVISRALASEICH